MGEVTSDSAALAPGEVARFALNVWSYKQGEVVSLMIHLGDRLGIYRALDGAGPLSAAALADRTGLHERWLLEWLKGQAAARLLDYHPGDRFELTPVVVKVETGVALGGIIERIREIRESTALNRKLCVDRRWLHCAFI